jgi:hypothetical protein
MAFVPSGSLVIETRVDQLWAVTADLPRHPEWNPFVVRGPISMPVRLSAFFVQPRRETILECLPERLLEHGFGAAARAPKERAEHLLRLEPSPGGA